MDVGFQVDVRVLGGAHHAGRIHFDGLQINRADFHAALYKGLADGVFRGVGGSAQRKAGSQGEGAV